MSTHDHHHGHDHGNVFHTHAPAEKWNWLFY